jgi:hypothetical protein
MRRRTEIAEYLVTVITNRKPQTYIIGEPDREKVVGTLLGMLKHPLDETLDLVPVSVDLLQDHGITAGQVRRIHL